MVVDKGAHVVFVVVVVVVVVDVVQRFQFSASVQQEAGPEKQPAQFASWKSFKIAHRVVIGLTWISHFE